MDKRVGVIVNRNSRGKSYHRLFAPLEGYDNVSFFDGIVTDNPPSNYDIIVMNSSCLQPIEVLEWCKYQGVKIVIDLDDFVSLPTDHINYNVFKNAVYAQHTRRIIAMADMVWCASKELAKHFGGQYIPNAINTDHEQWQQPYEPTHDIVYTGGSQNIPYLVQTLSKMKHNKASMICNGYLPSEKAWRSLSDLFGDKFEGLPPQSEYEYGKVYAKGRIAIAPVKDTWHNKFKSNLKILEAAAYKIPIICSNAYCYKGAPVLYENWHENIKRLRRSEQMRVDMGARLHEYATEHFNFKTINQERWQSLQSL